MSADADAKRAVECLILTRDEELNLPHTLEALLPWAKRVHIVDSGSRDRTLQIAREFAERFPGQVNVVERAWMGYARQKNWALETLPLEANWVLIVDADEVVLPDLRDEILAVCARDPASIAEVGFYINRYFVFLGRRIRHCGFYPSWNLRFFKRGRARYEEREVHEHMIADGPTGYLRGHMEHNDRRGMEAYMAKHNRYSTLEAREIHAAKTAVSSVHRHIIARPFGNARERRRWVKQRLYPRLPAGWLLRFCYMYVFRLGFLDGLTGLRFCLFMSAYEMLIGLKTAELRVQERQEASMTVPDRPAPPRPARRRRSADAAHQRYLSAAERGRSAFSTREKIARILWAMVQNTLFRMSFHNWYGWRRILVSAFGARLTPPVRFRRTVRIECPWNLTMGAESSVGDHAMLYCLGPVTVGDRVSISQNAHICAGTHDYTLIGFPLVRPPITIEDDVWVAADTFVGPGVTIGAGAILGARGCAFKDLEPWTIYGGNPARPLGARQMIAGPPLEEAVAEPVMPPEQERVAP